MAVARKLCQPTTVSMSGSAARRRVMLYASGTARAVLGGRFGRPDRGSKERALPVSGEAGICEVGVHELPRFGVGRHHVELPTLLVETEPPALDRGSSPRRS